MDKVARTASRGRPPSLRRISVADAALAVLAAEGARGLTHRAVDRAANLPAGSTSNYFRTRDALLSAALARHVDLDTPPGADPDQIEATALEPEQATAFVLAAVERILDPGRRALIVARYELFLESTRRAELREDLSAARDRFVTLTQALLRARGCEHSKAHARQLVALLDGLLIDQLLAADTALDRAGIEEAVRRFLVSC